MKSFSSPVNKEPKFNEEGQLIFKRQKDKVWKLWDTVVKPEYVAKQEKLNVESYTHSFVHLANSYFQDKIFFFFFNLAINPESNKGVTYDL